MDIAFMLFSNIEFWVRYEWCEKQVGICHFVEALYTSDFHKPNIFIERCKHRLLLLQTFLRSEVL